MLVWRRILEAIDRHGRAAMVTVAATRGSAPREAGARMVVHPDGAFAGTIGGGTLEWRAIALAQAALSGEPVRRAEIRSYALGPELGQCCGGRVDLLVEVFVAGDRDEVALLADREAAGTFATLGRVTPEGVPRTVSSGNVAPGSATLAGDTITEGFGDPSRHVWLFGAGHVGRALVLALAPLPFQVTWVDPRPDAFPSRVPANSELRSSADPPRELGRAPAGSFVLVMTHSHQLDLAVVHAALSDERFPYVGLIGSATKRARFEKRLAEAGVPQNRISGLACPIGIPGIRSKLPAVIAAGTAAELIIHDEALRSQAIDENPLYPVRFGRVG